MKSLFTIITLFLLVSHSSDSLYGQCIEHSFKTTEGTSAFTIEVANECQKDVYFTILGQKESGSIDSILRGYLKKGEKLAYRDFGRYISNPISHEMIIDSDYLKAKESVLAYIQNVQDKGSIASIEIASKEPVAAIEE